MLSAVCPETGEAEGLVRPVLNAEVVQLFLDQLSAITPPGTHRLLVWGGAGYHVAKALQVTANRTVLPLPPYAPERNPVERLWLYLRQHHWSNRVYPSMADLQAAAVAGRRAVCLTAERIKTVCRCDYLEPGT